MITTSIGRERYMLPGQVEQSAVLAHDLGNYIQIAMSAMRLMSSQPDCLSRTTGRLLEQAQDALERAGALMRSTMEPATGDVDALSLAEAISQMATLLRYASGPHIRIKLQTGVVPKVRISRLGLQNALLNLALNARDAMPEGGTLSISTLLAEGPDNVEVEIVVADTGTGIPAAVLKRIFEPYFTTRPMGRGLGLPAVKRFIEAAGGRIAVTSVPQAGTSVTLRLPAAL